MPSSSSTTRMLCMQDRGGSGLGRDRKFDDETRAHRLIFFYPDRAVMVFDDAAHNGEAESSAAPLGREIGEKRLFFQVLRNTLTAIGDGNLHHLAVADQRCCNLNFAHQRAVQS